MALPWIIGVLSTDYDLHEYRSAVINELKKKNIKVSAFEEADFPVEPDLHSHESCLNALKRVDIALLVIDKRYGGIYCNSKDTSITEKEFFTAIRKKIPCLIFVSKSTWDERNYYHKDLKQSGKKEIDFDKNYKCKYVEDIRVVHFVDKIQKIYEKNECSNWINIFNGIVELEEKVNGKLTGLSHFFLSELVNKQKEELKARKTSTSFSMSLGDVFDKGYYLDPEYEAESGTFTDEEAQLEDSIVEELENQKSVLVYGEAGYGKTTILAKSFLNHVEKFDCEDPYKIPFYIWLKDKSSGYHFDFDKYIQECFSKYKNKDAYPYMDLDLVTPFFYLDGFDEIAEKISDEEVKNIVCSTVFRHPVMLTSRKQYALRYLRNYDLSNKFNIRIMIKKWDVEKAKQYIDNFCRIKGKNQQYIDSIHALLTNNKDLSEILDNPLLITMLLWVIEANRMNIPETISTRVELFQECIKEMARRELHRSKLKSLNDEDLFLIWSYAAWLVYREKLLNKRIKVPAIIEELQQNYFPQYGTAYNESLLESMFDTTTYVIGTFHEQFLEFLVANTLCHACINKSEPYPEFLRYVVRPEINRYFRGIVDECSDTEKEVIAKNISDQYFDKVGIDTTDAISTRVHAIYHISRLKSSLREKSLQRAFVIENSISVKLSLYFGVIKMGKLNKEEEFYNLLVNDTKFNAANRGYHLLYYADIMQEMPLPYFDNGKDEWSNTLKAFIRHFKSGKIEQYYLWRIDLVTMMQFMETRKSVGMLSKEILTDIEICINNPPVSRYVDFQNKVEEAFGEIKEMYERIGNS